MGPMGPLSQLTPDMLMKMAAAGFRPPALMAPPGLPGMPGMQQDPGMAGFKAPNMGLSGWRPQGATRTGGDADLGGYGGSPPLDPTGNPMNLPNPNGQQYLFTGSTMDGATGTPMGAVEQDGPSGFRRALNYIGGLF